MGLFYGCCTCGFLLYSWQSKCSPPTLFTLQRAAKTGCASLIVRLLRTLTQDGELQYLLFTPYLNLNEVGASCKSVEAVKNSKGGFTVKTLKDSANYEFDY